jgi:hypothetical protein
MNTDVLIVVLTTGLQLIAEVEMTEKEVILTHPMVVVSIPPKREGEGPGVAFAPYLQYTKNFEAGVIIKTRNVLSLVDPVEDLEKKYRSIFSGLIL